jgi:hypothetical protein
MRLKEYSITVKVNGQPVTLIVDYPYNIDGDNISNLTVHIGETLKLLAEQGLEIVSVFPVNPHSPTQRRIQSNQSQASTRICPKCKSPLNFKLAAYPNGEKGEGWFCSRVRDALCSYVSWIKMPAHLAKQKGMFPNE